MRPHVTAWSSQGKGRLSRHQIRNQVICELWCHMMNELLPIPQSVPVAQAYKYQLGMIVYLTASYDFPQPQKLDFYLVMQDGANTRPMCNL